MNNMLQAGDTGENVKEMQKLLRTAGLFKHSKDTGFFGPKTETALKEFQRLRGIKIDGQYGPRSKDMLENDQKVRAMLANPALNGTPHQEVLKRMYGGGDHRINLVADGMHTTPADLKNRMNNFE